MITKLSVLTELKRLGHASQINWDKLPRRLFVRPHLMQILKNTESVSRNYTYTAGFPSFKDGRYIAMNRDILRNWILSRQADLYDQLLNDLNLEGLSRKGGDIHVWRRR